MERTDAPPPRKGRAAAFNTPNRFEPLHVLEDAAALDDADLRQIRTEFLRDSSKSILSKNDSPDVPFTFSINPYRGCEHGCIYCYARPSHEYLGFSAGLDFETKIMVKPDAPKLLERAFMNPSWKPQTLAISGNTDPYQPIEKKLELTRRCLEVCLKFGNPVGIITKNYLVTRDLDILTKLAEKNLVHVTLSITSLRDDLTGVMEPRTSRPVRRLAAIEKLSEAGVSVGVNIAPIVPGLTDEELPAIMKAAAERGAVSAGYIVMRLPGPVKDLFVDWINREYPDRADKVLRRIRSMRGGELSDPRFKSRMRGEGEWADALSTMFKMTRRRFNLDRRQDLSTGHFQRPGQQMGLF
ncbi:MAG: PA0069 family radical SAM protein [Bacteroidota bacterium]